MYACYLLSFLSLGMMLVLLAQNFFHFSVFAANELTFGILTSVVYLFTETLVIFFFVGTGVSVKEYVQAHGLSADYHRASIAIKRYMYPPQLLNMLLIMIAIIMIGAVDTGRMPVWIYRGYFVFCLGHFVYAKLVQHKAFRESTFNILAMAGVK